MLFSPANDLIITACDQPELPRVEVCDSLHSPSVFCLRALKGRRTVSDSVIRFILDICFQTCLDPAAA